MHSLTLDLKIAFRRLAATPWFTLFATATLALGIGVTTAAYAVVDTILWKPFAVADPNDVLRVTNRRSSTSSIACRRCSLVLLRRTSSC
jgi:hypothetical protein